MVTIGLSYSDALDMDHTDRIYFVEMAAKREDEIAKRLGK